MANLSLLDLGFVLFESDSTPLHISGLALLTPPEGEEDGFGRRMVEQMLASGPPCPPFNSVLKLGVSNLPQWQEARSVDLDYHIRHSRLPGPGDMHQLLELVSRIHSYRLDRSRPMWELWVIDGLADGKVAVLSKLHHALADGVRASRMFANSCTPEPDGVKPPFWVTPIGEDRAEQRQRDSLLKALLKSPKLVKRQFGANVGLAKLAGKLALNWFNLSPTRLKVPFTAPRTPFNVNHDRARTVVLAKLPLSRFTRIAKLTGCTANDVMLTVSDMALQKYLQVHNWSSKKPMVALMPINLRQDGDAEQKCNKFVPGLVELGASDDDPLVRLRTIRNGTAGIKLEALELSPDAYFQYSLVVNGLSLLAGKVDVFHYLPPATNMLISNVPGPKERLYFMGAEVDTIYPLSLLLPGQTLNITLLSYNGEMHFGLVCCRRSLPGFEAMDEYLHQALLELEQATLAAVTEVVREKLAG